MNHINPDGCDLSGQPRDPALLHLYAQAMYHFEAYVVGNRAGLLKLREAIDAALAGEGSRGTGCARDVFVRDGEGYDVFVVREDAPWRGPPWDRLAVPYTDESASSKRKDAIWPHQLVGDTTDASHAPSS